VCCALAYLFSAQIYILAQNIRTSAVWLYAIYLYSQGNGRDRDTRIFRRSQWKERRKTPNRMRSESRLTANIKCQNAGDRSAMHTISHTQSQHTRTSCEGARVERRVRQKLRYERHRLKLEPGGFFVNLATKEYYFRFIIFWELSIFFS